MPNETAKAPTGTRPSYFTEKIPGLGVPRWRFGAFIILCIILGNVFRNFLVSKYSLPQSEAFFFSFIAVVLFGMVCGLVLGYFSRRVVR